MGAGIQGPPNTYPAGLDFDYSVWTPGTRVDLVNVNWDNNYRDVVKFTSKTALNTYINNKISAGITVNSMTYAKPGEDIYLGIPYNRVNRYNYLRASNPLMPIEGDIQKDYYYFILECEFVNPNTTRLRVQLDVWQTYVYDATFGNCYVERGHIGVANTNKFNNFGRDYLTVPEGIDIGGEYRTIARRTETLIQNPGVGFDEGTNGDIIVISSVDLAASGATPNELVTASGASINGMPSGADFYVFTDVGSFIGFMDSIATAPWMSQGIISVTFMPSVSRYAFNGAEITNGQRVDQLVTVPHNVSMFSNWRDNAGIRDNIPNRYQHVEDKFFTYPYMVIEITAFAGNANILKPEMWNDLHANVQERASYLPPNQRVSIHPRGYNMETGANVDNLWGLTDSQVNTLNSTQQNQVRDRGDDGSEYLDIAVTISNFPSVPVVNNMALGFLASNANQLAYQFTAADWTQQRALGMAQGSFDVASGALQTANRATGINTDADVRQTANQNRTQAAQAAVSAAGQVVSGVGNALTPSGAGGAAISGLSNGAVTGLNTAIGIASNDEALATRYNQSWQQLSNENQQGRLVRDTNKNLADWAARGDYGSQISGINAKIQDAKMIQPSTGGQFGGESHLIGTDKLAYSLRWKLIDEASIRTVGEIWLRFGYNVRAFIQMPATLMCMTKFTYWKVTETYISGSSIPEGHKQVLRGIMEKGVTVWVNPDEIGQIDWADNAPIGGIAY